MTDKAPQTVACGAGGDGVHDPEERGIDKRATIAPKTRGRQLFAG
jgi:hypothetical protein